MTLHDGRRSHGPFVLRPGGTRPAGISHYCPGGRDHGGGIGRMVGNIADAAASGIGAVPGTEADTAPRDHVIRDTRGPRLNPLTSPLRLIWVIMLLLRDRVCDPGRIHHFHIAGRGSTWRKLILTTVARSLGARHVLHLHDYDYRQDFVRRPRPMRRLICRMFRGADAVVVLGQRDRAMVADLLGVSRRRITVMANAVPDPGPSPVKAELPVNILFLGRLGPRKGVPELLDALTRIPDLPWRAVLAGDGPVAQYRQQAEALGLGARIAMPGWLDPAGVTALCRKADILVLPSHAEGLAMALLEGLAHGLAVVTTRVGAHDEVITDGVSGLFVPVGDPAALARTLEGLILDPALRAHLGTGGRRLYQAGFGMGLYIDRLDRLYDRIDARRAPAPVPT